MLGIKSWQTCQFNLVLKQFPCLHHSFSPSTIIVDFKTTTKNISGLKENRHKVRRIQNFSSLNDSVSAILLRLWSVGITFCVYKVDISICIVLFITYVSCLMICYLHCLGDSWETKFIFPVLWLSQVFQSFIFQCFNLTDYYLWHMSKQPNEFV